MIAKICHIISNNGDKSFSLASIYILRECFCVKLCMYYKERYDDGCGLFYLQIGQFTERRFQFGIKVRVFRYEWTWYKKRKATAANGL